jgi:hypothetical protein
MFEIMEGEEEKRNEKRARIFSIIKAQGGVTRTVGTFVPSATWDAIPTATEARPLLHLYLHVVGISHTSCVEQFRVVHVG